MKILPIFASLVLCAVGGAAFAGSKTLRLDGRFEYRTDEESHTILGNQVCYFPSNSSAAMLPRAAGDKRLAWFCFSETARATRDLGIPLQSKVGSCGSTGTAIVEVSDYKVFTGEGDGNDVAVLQSVLKKSKALPLTCAQ